MDYFILSHILIGPVIEFDRLRHHLAAASSAPRAKSAIPN